MVLSPGRFGWGLVVFFLATMKVLFHLCHNIYIILIFFKNNKGRLMTIQKRRLLPKSFGGSVNKKHEPWHLLHK
jgi:hypothetical protein